MSLSQVYLHLKYFNSFGDRVVLLTKPNAVIPFESHVWTWPHFFHTCHYTLVYTYANCSEKDLKSVANQSENYLLLNINKSLSAGSILGTNLHGKTAILKSPPSPCDYDEYDIIRSRKDRF